MGAGGGCCLERLSLGVVAKADPLWAAVVAATCCCDRSPEGTFLAYLVPAPQVSGRWFVAAPPPAPVATGPPAASVDRRPAPTTLCPRRHDAPADGAVENASCSSPTTAVGKPRSSSSPSPSPAAGLVRRRRLRLPPFCQSYLSVAIPSSPPVTCSMEVAAARF